MRLAACIISLPAGLLTPAPLAKRPGHGLLQLPFTNKKKHPGAPFGNDVNVAYELHMGP